MKIDETDQRLLARLADGLPQVSNPYAAIGARLGLDEQEVISRICGLIDSGVVKRFGIVVRHKELGYHANAMITWDVPDNRIAELGPRIAAHSFVTLCYERQRAVEWPYNLYCMIHGSDRETVLSQIDGLCRDEGIEDLDKAVLFSQRRFKQRGARYGIESRSLAGAA